ncbi:MAG: hypothetical protein SFX72_13165 [Isosphaeraceae bacterium]|nr:hypothetical protein [Isosphaeraceae bacterium]
MAVSEKQLLANRENAKRSTGPRTPEGKAVSRTNALRHGLCAEVVPLPDEDPVALEADRRAFVEEIAPRGRMARRYAEQAYADFLRLIRFERAEDAAMLENVAGADREWLIAREQERRKAFATLAESPTVSVHILESSPEGCLELVDAWRGIAGRIQRREPLELEGEPRPIDLLALHRTARLRYKQLDRAYESGRTANPSDPTAGERFREAERGLLEIATDIAEEYEELSEAVRPDYEFRRSLAPRMAQVDLSPAGRTRRRYASAASRAMHLRIALAKQAAAEPERWDSGASALLRRPEPVSQQSVAPQRSPVEPAPARERSASTPAGSTSPSTPTAPASTREERRNEPISASLAGWTADDFGPAKADRLPFSIVPPPRMRSGTS